MLTSKQLREKAWNSLKGKYSKALLVTIIAGIFTSFSFSLSELSTRIMAINDLALEGDITLDAVMAAGFFVILAMAGIALVLGLILNVLVESPALIGCCGYFIKNTYTKPSLAEVFSGFRTRYGRNIVTMLLLWIKLFLWTLLLIVPGIIKSFEYAIVPYILADDSEISCKDAFKKAKEMMRGNKWRLFVLNFSFIGWMLLCVAIGVAGAFIHPLLAAILPGIAALALVPYIDAANAEFYMELKNK